MKEILIYREPKAKQINAFEGRFSLIQPGEKPFGFVVSDFLHETIYSFQVDRELTEVDQLYFAPETPVVISRRDYQIEAQAFLNSFPLLGVQKGVYSRVKQTPFQSEKAVHLFEKLEESYPNTFCYLISSPHFGTWVGATPELLMHQEGMRCKTVALAGTHGEHEQHAWTPKEQEEHQFVVDAIHEVLQKNECVEIELDGPYEQQAGPVIHLKTDFQALLTKPNAWELAQDLHPTPAVCGTPRPNSLAAIQSREMHDRGLYTGFIGWFEEGNTRLFVNLRCAQLYKEQAFLYVGGGFTVDSIPDMEWEETEKKAQTLIRVMKDL